jgi:hypothetical protein
MHENGPDAAHLGVVHTDAAYFPLLLKHDWSATWEALKDDQKHMSKIQVNQSVNIMGLFKIPFSDATVNLNQVGPGIVHYKIATPFGTAIVYETVVPLRPFYTRMDHIIYAQWSVPRFVAKMALYTIADQVTKDMVQSFYFNFSAYLVK